MYFLFLDCYVFGSREKAAECVGIEADDAPRTIPLSQRISNWLSDRKTERKTDMWIRLLCQHLLSLRKDLYLQL